MAAHLRSMGLDYPSFQSPGSGGEKSRPARSRSCSQKRPRHPSESCCLLCARSLETQGSHISLALRKKKWVYMWTDKIVHKASKLHFVTCAVFAIPTVRVDAGTSVGALCVLTPRVFVTVWAECALIHIWTHTNTQLTVYLPVHYWFKKIHQQQQKQLLDTHPDKLVDFLPTSRCWHSVLWCLPAGKSQRYTGTRQSCQHGSPSPETIRSPEDEEAHRTPLEHTAQSSTI